MQQLLGHGGQLQRACRPEEQRHSACLLSQPLTAHNDATHCAPPQTLYALAALEPARASVQIIHEQDPCCFHGCHRHGRIRQYNEWVAGVGAGLFQTCVTAGNVHEVNPRDKAVFASLLDKYRIAGALTRADLDALPFNLLREY